MLSHRVFDHSLISANDECRLRDEEEEADHFERVDRGRRQTAVKIVYQHDELIDFCLLEELREFIPKMMNLLRYAFFFRWLQKVGGLVDLILDVVCRHRLHIRWRDRGVRPALL